MPDPSALDLATAETWFGIRPGMTHAEVLAALKNLSVVIDEESEGYLAATIHDYGAEFWFATDGSQRLRQLAVDSDDFYWNGKELLDATLDTALNAIGPASPPVWEANNATSDPFPEPDPDPRPVSDEELLEEGTIWLMDRGLGFVICEADVYAAVWRDKRDLPTQLAGPVTDAQRKWSEHPDLEDHLRKKQAERFEKDRPKDPMAPIRKVLTFALIVALVLLGKKGLEDMQLWGNAPTIDGKFLGVTQAPMKQFRDFLPPALRWAVPRTAPVIVDAYRVEFTRPDGERQEVVLERGELYVPPQQEGEQVPVVYVATDPPRVSGLSRARDTAFVDNMPWVIVIVSLYLVAQFALKLLPALLRQLPQFFRKLAPGGVIKDPNRPELR